ncbi:MULTISPECIES: cation:proton antiporter [Terrabacteria group]|uniref:cation:proton antiporter n=1 Tax=Bacillati TaxID=1783272 RepID=UPI001939A355|nr:MULTISPECIES: cation:proton antiporter [Terrabacteria group]MBW9212157.1 cation:proton antiporter [Trueperella sp. zg.1013]QRG86298.1 cation:proton antiporter [Bulleidia sp. zg-1006]
MSITFHLGLAILTGLLLTLLTKKAQLPNVTAYILIGVLIGPHLLQFINHDILSSLGVIPEVALGFIAFSIGDEFELKALKAIGKPALIITLFEALGAVLIVDTITLLLGFPPAECLILGALAASTAPAATLMIIRQYKADGPLTRMLLPVVAADDAIGLIAYSISISIAVGMVNHQSFSFISTILLPIAKVLGSLVLGIVLGICLSFLHRYFQVVMNRMSLCVSFVLMACALAKYLGLSDLLVCMALGSAYVNTRKDAQKVLLSINDWTYPLFILFFVLSGAELDLAALPKVGVLGVLYIVLRFGGKWLGSYLGSGLSKQPSVIKNYIGFALMPQAGVAIGLATLVIKDMPGEIGKEIQTIILSATLVYELIGPLAAKFALKQANEIHV